VAITFTGLVATNKGMLQRGSGATKKMLDVALKYGWTTSAIDFGGYTALNAAFKKHDRLSREIRNQVLIEQGFPEKMRSFVERRPDIIGQMDEKFSKMNELWAKYEGTQGREEEMYQEFLKFGLIEELKDDRKFHDVTKQILEDAFYMDAYADPLSNNIDFFGISVTPPKWIDDAMNVVQIQSGAYGASPELAAGIDRIIFYRMYDLPINPMAWVSYARSQMVYEVLCKMRLAPAASYSFAILLTAVLKISTDPIKYYARKNMTGH